MKWAYIPLQDFTSNSDIDWSKSIAQIDQQLYAKYGLAQDEIDFIESKVKAIIVDKLGVDEAEVKPEASFTNDLGADSLDTVELVMALEEEFETEIPDEEAEKINTVQAAIDYVTVRVRCLVTKPLANSNANKA